jgi:hypothetical protein
MVNEQPSERRFIGEKRMDQFASGSRNRMLTGLLTTTQKLEEKLT